MHSLSKHLPLPIPQLQANKVSLIQNEIQTTCMYPTQDSLIHSCQLKKKNTVELAFLQLQTGLHPSPILLLEKNGSSYNLCHCVFMQLAKLPIPQRLQK